MKKKIAVAEQWADVAKEQAKLASFLSSQQELYMSQVFSKFSAGQNIISPENTQLVEEPVKEATIYEGSYEGK